MSNKLNHADFERTILVDVSCKCESPWWHQNGQGSLLMNGQRKVCLKCGGVPGKDGEHERL